MGLRVYRVSAPSACQSGGVFRLGGGADFGPAGDVVGQIGAAEKNLPVTNLYARDFRDAVERPIRNMKEICGLLAVEQFIGMRHKSPCLLW
ncbi:hypothetical protein AruPA_02680 [Acidiphilium sp. PA]|uniref:hypothetical protein n=1 Tax=Acidiphilium sp. PA TaxID=2871705 RepID=UPI0022449ADC|nr:hypothetical protein [Acidiphilium sp. PA]MCW8305929.1 hypothetical protein [Acidiphilium sp. PA]